METQEQIAIRKDLLELMQKHGFKDASFTSKLRHFDNSVSKWVSSLENPGYRLRYEAVKKIARRFKGFTLDIGCGPGLYAKLFEPHQYIGLDFSGGMVVRAKQDNPNHIFVLGLADRLHFANSTFDLVLSVAVTEYLENVTNHVNEVARVLNPEGHAVIVFRNGYEQWRERDKNILRWLGKGVEEKTWIHHSHKPTDLFHPALRVVEEKYLGVHLVPGVFDKRVRLNRLLEKCITSKAIRMKYCSMGLILLEKEGK